ncbi:MAG: lipo-like protein [Beijerinckiaceae bacterium]|nr:lipo-like protein [Beijerinckiaceae bacterium]
MNGVLQFMSDRLVTFLNKDVKGCHSCTTNSAEALRRTIQPGDVLLVEGTSRVSSAIQYLTQSTWSHAALCVGPVAGTAAPDGEPHMLVEALLGQGVVTSTISSYGQAHTRICRPVGLTETDRQRVIDFALSRVGHDYDMRNVIDLARYLLPQPPIPKRFRRKMLKLGSGSPTQAICSTLIAAAFESVKYPILPHVELLPSHDDAEEFRREILYIRHHTLYAPRDFDISPYFHVAKPTIEQGFDYRKTIWGDSFDEAQSCPMPERGPGLSARSV